MDNQVDIKPKKKRGCLIGFLIVVAIIIGIIILIIRSGDSIFEDLANDRLEHEQQNAVINTISAAVEMTEEQEAAIMETFSAVGIYDIIRIEDITHRADGYTSFRLHNADTQFYGGFLTIWISEDKSLDGIYRVSSPDIFTGGEIVTHLRDVFPALTAERDRIIPRARELIMDVLEFPDTAQFETSWAFSRQGENIVAQSTVNAQNALGMREDIFFQVTLNSWNIPISLIIDGQELLDQDINGN